MEESTRKLSIDLKNMINDKESYVTTHHTFTNFIGEESLDKLIKNLEDPEDSKNKTYLKVIDSDEMLSEQTKVLIHVEDTIFHFFMDSLTLILKVHREHPGIKFVLYLQRNRPNKSIESFIQLLKIILDGEGVDYVTISTSPSYRYAPVYRFKNYVYMDQEVLDYDKVLSFLDVEKAADLAIKYSKDYLNVTKTVEPFRKVYISRPGISSDLGPIEEGYPDYKDDIRMNDAWKVEEFFVSMGYDAFSPEKHFDSIMEQIVYMTEVKTLASITSSGLANMVFMQPNQTVIELQAELVTVVRFRPDTLVRPQQWLHGCYSTLSFMRDHTHITVSSRRDPDKVIKTLTSGQLSYLI
jgi:hypothetical protein